MLLESFRHDTLGEELIYIKGSPQKRISASFTTYTMKAFYLTMQDLQELEYSKGEIVPDGRNVHLAISFWFLALESYINAHLKITCLKLGKNFELFKKKKIAERFTALLELLNIDTIEIKKTGIHSRINEFTHFRNELLHDRHVGADITFKKTHFSSIPIQCNLVDELQAFIIYMEVCCLLRYSITGLDTMPDIQIHEIGKIFFKKLDLLYHQIVVPATKEILKKHGLETNLDLDFTFPSAIQSSIFTQGEVCFAIITDSPKEMIHRLSDEKSDISHGLWVEMANSVIIESGKFRIPNYYKK